MEEDHVLLFPDMEGFMSALPYMPVYVSDMVAATAYMTLEERGGYITLLMLAWQNGGVPNDKDVCSRMVGGISDSAWATIRKHLTVLDSGTTDERLSHPRLEKVREEFESKYRKKCDAAARARQGRKEKTEADAAVDVPNLLVSGTVSSPNSSPSSRTNSEAPLVLTTTTTSTSSSSLFSGLSFDPARGFTGLTKSARAELRASLPQIDLDTALAKAKLHLIAEPERAKQLIDEGKLHTWLLHWLFRERPGRPGEPVKKPVESWLKDYQVAEYKRPREATAARSRPDQLAEGVPRPSLKMAPQIANTELTE